MPQIGTVVLTDRESTPVDHSFLPYGEDANGVWSLRESSGTPIADNILTLARHRTPNRVKTELRFTFPVAQNEIIDGVSTPKIVRTARARVELDFDITSNTQERDNVVGMVRSALSSDANRIVIDKTIVDNEGVW
jgi:hypothetical protein